jgi:hypothetical protein
MNKKIEENFFEKIQTNEVIKIMQTELMLKLFLPSSYYILYPFISFSTKKFLFSKENERKKLISTHDAVIRVL